GVCAQQVRQIRRIIWRMADGQRGPLRIYVERSHVQAELRLGLGHQKTRHAASRRADRSAEPEPLPAGIFAAIERATASLDVQLERAVPPRYAEWNAQGWAAFQERILRSFDLAREAVHHA